MTYTVREKDIKSFCTTGIFSVLLEKFSEVVNVPCGIINCLSEASGCVLNLYSKLLLVCVIIREDDAVDQQKLGIKF